MTEKHKGSRSAKDILEQLNNGQIETANLVEWLAVDQSILLESLLKQTVNMVNEAIGTGVFYQANQNNDIGLFEITSNHKSDLVRCWAAYTSGKDADLTLAEILERIQPFWR